MQRISSFYCTHNLIMCMPWLRFCQVRKLPLNSKTPNSHVKALCLTSSFCRAPSTKRTLRYGNRFFKMLENDALRAWYGESHVMKAAERGAISKLLISDRLFRSADPKRRKAFVKLTEDVKAFGGETLIFSSMHESGQRESDSKRYSEETDCK